MAHIPDDLIPAHIKNPMNRQRSLHHAQVGGQVSPIMRNHLYDFLPDILRQQLELLWGHSLEPCRILGLIQIRIFHL